jgi:hypothetical protein
MKIEKLFEAKEKSLINVKITNKSVTYCGKIRDHWDGEFYCNEIKLTSLEGAPRSIGGSFNCSRNMLTSLEGAPRSIERSFYCAHNMLTSLKDIHKQVQTINGWFYVNYNPIKSHVLRFDADRWTS